VNGILERGDSYWEEERVFVCEVSNQTLDLQLLTMSDSDFVVLLSTFQLGKLMLGYVYLILHCNVVKRIYPLLRIVSIGSVR